MAEDPCQSDPQPAIAFELDHRLGARLFSFCIATCVATVANRSTKMSSSSRKATEFPEAENKLQAGGKKSLFERQKAEAEAKRLREEAETKAVYEDFVKSFDDEDEQPGMGGGGGFGGSRYGAPPPPPQRRGFGSASGMGGYNAPTGPGSGRGFSGASGSIGRNSGPGSLGPAPSSLSKKRTFEGFQQQSRRDDRGLLAFDDYAPEREREPKRVFQTSDDEEDERKVMDRGEEKAAAKPTLRLSSLPPGTSPAFIKSLIPTNLSVDSVRIIPPAGPGPATERKSTTAIVTLAKDTPANDIDSAVNQLQNHYVGFGYYLSLHRHLSSAAISSTTLPTTTSSAQTSQPFGAKPVSLNPANPQVGRPPPPPHHNSRFAPPTSYGAPLPNISNQPLHVPVTPPSSLKTLKLIHKTLELLLTHGPEFEALLMTRPTVQRSPHFAFLWDARSSDGVYYRYRLWSILTSSKAHGKYLPLFEGSSAWKAPEKAALPWEYTTELSSFVSDSEYNSSDEDDSDNENSRREQNPSGIIDGEEGNAYLTPLAKAKLTHLLSRLPTTTALLRKGDVARVTAFAITHAGRGSDEVVSLLCSNILRPFAFTSANPTYHKKDAKPTADNDGPNPATEAGEAGEAEEDEKEDRSSAQQIALYLISDILSSSSTSGVRHAWRYRAHFESALQSHHIFASLGRLERKLKWGRLRGEKWKRSVNNLLNLWEGWCVFSSEAMERFKRDFEKPPLSEAEEREEEEKRRESERERVRWKAVDNDAAVGKSAAAPTQDEDEDLDGVPMADEDLDGVPMADEDLDGIPMDDADLDGEPMDEDAPPPTLDRHPPPHDDSKVEDQKAERDASNATETRAEAAAKKRRRPIAADMFADSDEE